MKKQNIILVLLVVLTIFLGSYIVYLKWESLGGIFEKITTPTTKQTELSLCSNEYFTTEYDKDGRIVIKDFPYKEVINQGVCKENENGVDLEAGLNSSKSIRVCYLKNLSLGNIRNLTCVQKLELGGLKYPDPSYWYFDKIEQKSVKNICFLENTDLSYLSGLINLEEIVIDSCSNQNWNNIEWNKLNKLKKITISNFHSENKDQLFDDFLPIVGQIESLEYVRLSYMYKPVDDYWPLTGIIYYKNYNKLCEWINTWKNVRAIELDSSNYSRVITINQNGEFVSVEENNEVTREVYKNCLEWLEKQDNYDAFHG